MDGDGAYYTNLLNESIYNETFELQQTPPIKDNNPSLKPNQKQKGKNFSEDEDRLLVAAWLNVSADPIQGTNQTKATFWKRIFSFYETNRGAFAERTQNSLLHRWGSIQEAVSKFCACLSQTESINQSGMTIHDRVEQAEKLFKTLDSNNKSFQFRHSWLQLRNQPKWHDKLQQLASTKTGNKRQKTTKNSSPGQAATIDLTTQDGNQIVPPETIIPETDAPQRPIGKKKAKELLRRGSTDACNEALEILWAKKKEADAEKELKREERYAKAYALDKERLELEQKRLAIEEQKHTNEQKRLEQEKERLVNETNALYIKRLAEEERIMAMDLSTMNDLQKEYYMCLQAEIMARRIN